MEFQVLNHLSTIRRVLEITLTSENERINRLLLSNVNTHCHAFLPWFTVAQAILILSEHHRVLSTDIFRSDFPFSREISQTIEIRFTGGTTPRACLERNGRVHTTLQGLEGNSSRLVRNGGSRKSETFNSPVEITMYGFPKKISLSVPKKMSDAVWRARSWWVFIAASED